MDLFKVLSFQGLVDRLKQLRPLSKQLNENKWAPKNWDDNWNSPFKSANDWQNGRNNFKSFKSLAYLRVSANEDCFFAYCQTGI